MGTRSCDLCVVYGAEDLSSRRAGANLLHVGACPGPKANECGWWPRDGGDPTMALETTRADAAGNGKLPVSPTGREAGPARLAGCATEEPPGFYSGASQYTTATTAASGEPFDRGWQLTPGSGTS